MTQNDSYPDPAQVRSFIDEPMPVHDMNRASWRLTDEAHILVEFAEVTYDYRPGTPCVLVETGVDGTYEPIGETGYDLTPTEAYQRAETSYAEEDFIDASGLVGLDEGETTALYDATWILDEMVIRNR